jgi:hypothetical protein
MRATASSANEGRKFGSLEKKHNKESQPSVIDFVLMKGWH